MNRVAKAIEVQRERLAKGVKVDGSPITADLAQFERSMDNTPFEHAVYQEKKSIAQMRGLITLAEAQTIYKALGEVPGKSGWASGTDLATKVVITGLMAELIGVR